MKKVSVLAAFFCLLFAASAVFAQSKATNFAGSWELDAAKSKLPERMRVESMTLNVTQSDKEIKVETNAKRAARPEGDQPPASPGVNGRMRPGGGMMGGGNGTVTYSLDGKETTVESETPNGMPPSSATFKAAMEKDGRLILTSSRSFDTPTGSTSIKTTETWELIGGGKALKVSRDTETPRGTQSSEMYFVKKAAAEGKTYEGKIVSEQPAIVSDVASEEMKNSSAVSADRNNQSPKIVRAGVINAKALKLVQPDYPPAARAVRATGAVQVEVTFDEQGNVISAAAISGHPLLQSAAVEAARNSKFAPVTLGGVPVQISGIIVYNFTPR